ncbi:MAG: SDR family oxidoreductase [Verrucomicrobiales bacterium]|nr:SDR family oxidoreductase [Verrucomicrobiales bacterium]
MTDESILKPGAVALVTGASSGIGRAIVQSLLCAGLRVVCVARNRMRLQEVTAMNPDQTLSMAIDVTDPSAVAGIVEALPEEWRTIDILVANAGSDVGGRRRFDEGNVSDWASTIETNVMGVIRICHAVIPGMLERGRGHVVTMGSVAGFSTYAGGSIYAASKHAVHAFTDSLRKDYLTDPIRITEIMPGLVRTGFAEARHKGDSAQSDAFYDSFPAVLEAENIASSAMFALSQPQSVNISQIVVVSTGNKWQG